MYLPSTSFIKEEGTQPRSTGPFGLGLRTTSSPEVYHRLSLENFLVSEVPPLSISLPVLPSTVNFTLPRPGPCVLLTCATKQLEEGDTDEELQTIASGRKTATDEITSKHSDKISHGTHSGTSSQTAGTRTSEDTTSMSSRHNSTQLKFGVDRLLSSKSTVSETHEVTDRKIKEDECRINSFPLDVSPYRSFLGSLSDYSTGNQFMTSADIPSINNSQPNFLSCDISSSNCSCNEEMTSQCSSHGNYIFPPFYNRNPFIPFESVLGNNLALAMSSSLDRRLSFTPSSITRNVTQSPKEGGSSRRKRTWTRAVFSNLQRKGLEKRFLLQKYITKPDRRQLAATLGLTDAQVKVWFQNRRMKWRHAEMRKMKCKEGTPKTCHSTAKGGKKINQETQQVTSTQTNATDFNQEKFFSESEISDLEEFN